MRKWLNNYFEFSKREFNGLLILIMLIAGISVFPYIYHWISPKPGPSEEEQLAVLKLAMAEEIKMKTNREGFIDVQFDKYKEDQSTLFHFDPNHIGLAEWQKLGLSAKQAQAILNYRKKGGVFRKKEDLKRMYTINERTYQRLLPFVQIAGDQLQGNHELKLPEHPQKMEVIKPRRGLIEVNNADTAMLDEIKGIGKVFALRIVKYRERLGGFHKKEQLLEVFGIDSGKYQEIKDQIAIDLSGLKKINVNTANFDDFKNHPYIRYKQVNALIAYRKQHGNYSNIADLNKIAILTPEMIMRLAPYLTY